MPKKKSEKFIPFVHENLDLKNGLINSARELGTQEDLGPQLASALIYASFAEYIAGHLLENLRYWTHKATYEQYNGVLFIDERNAKEIHMMGNIIRELKSYNFPDKDSILYLLDEIAKSRNNVFHNLAKIDTESAKKVDEDIARVRLLGEDLFNKTNTVYAGLQAFLNSQSNNPITTE